MIRLFTKNATGIAPDGRWFAGDVNALQDAVAAITDLTQHIALGSISIGEDGLQLLQYASGEARLSGHARFDGILRGLSGLIAGSYSSVARDAIVSPPATLIIWNSTTLQFEYNAGSAGTPNWLPVGSVQDGAITTAKLANLAVTAAKMANGTITATQIAAALKPSGGAADATEALRAIGVAAGTAAAGNDARLSDTRIPTDNTVSTNKLQALAVTGAKIDNLTITSGKLADGAVTTAKILDANVTSAKIADLGVLTAKINDLAVTTAKINDLAVTTGKINDLGVTTGKINDLAVTTGKIAAGAVTPAKMSMKVDGGVIGPLDIGYGAGAGEFAVVFATAFAATPGIAPVYDNTGAHHYEGGDDSVDIFPASDSPQLALVASSNAGFTVRVSGVNGGVHLSGFHIRWVAAGA